jgi:hypothetical protein
MKPLGVGEWVVIGFCILLGLVFLWGMIDSRRRSGSIVDWLRHGLKGYASVSDPHWLAPGTFNVRISFKQKNVIKELLMVFLLERRENLPLWIFQKLRGKQDEVVLHANLYRQPERHLSILTNLKDSRPFPVMSGSNGSRVDYKSFSILSDGEISAQKNAGIISFLDAYSMGLRRLVLKPQTPHLMVEMYLSYVKKDTPETFLKALGEILS